LKEAFLIKKHFGRFAYIMLFKIDKNVEFSRNYGFFFGYALFGADVSLAKFAVRVLPFLPKFQSVL